MTSILDNLPGIGRINQSLQGWPDYYLTIFLLALAVFGVVIALFAPPVLKAGVIAYWIFP